MYEEFGDDIFILYVFSPIWMFSILHEYAVLINAKYIWKYRSAR